MYHLHGTQIRVKNVSRLCHAKPIVTVNGMFPGPTIYVREGDQVLVNVSNHAQYNMSIHWPKRNTVVACSYLVAKSHGEWWNSDVETIVNQGNKLGLPPQTSDAHTINGKPGPLFPCSDKHTFAMEVESGKTYLLRIINAALNDELFFAVAGHSMTVVEIDAVYTKPFATQAILIAPGQTTNVLIKADQTPSRYFMAARPFMDAPISVDNKTVTAILQCKGIPNTVIPSLPTLPAPNDTTFALGYSSKLKSLNTPQFPAKVPRQIDRHLFYAVGLGQNPCPTCQNGTKLTASLNNITFVMPKIGLLQAYYFNISGVFRTDFPDRPPVPFNYTGVPLTANLGTSLGTRLSKVAFNSTIELVLQDTNLLTVESHPFHLHGFNFFVVGTGVGNFDPTKDPAKSNLVDPPERNTVRVPTGGWTAIRFRADNPGVWFMHCHLELHTMWGLKMAFVVENGKSPEESILPPPEDLPPC
ncbi:unnamed protein product [Dovyalis caffra]|uniref:Laccase n=1 Tax=Dovyalis caffra TaxID=77055 RepID=A0AAV1S398_9ROSI|nr:unnamed protein product [Dovyalis caffra]